jgi:hypothetical protein
VAVVGSYVFVYVVACAVGGFGRYVGWRGFAVGVAGAAVCAGAVTAPVVGAAVVGCVCPCEAFHPACCAGVSDAHALGSSLKNAGMLEEVVLVEVAPEVGGT